jgi:hypothetical protein
MKNYIHVGDIGTPLGGYIKDKGIIVDVSNATEKIIRLQPPNGQTVAHPAAFVTNGLDGGIQYTSLEDTLHTEGVWLLQGFVKLPTGEWSSRVYKFRVYPKI